MLMCFFIEGHRERRYEKSIFFHDINKYTKHRHFFCLRKKTCLSDTLDNFHLRMCD